MAESSPGREFSCVIFDLANRWPILKRSIFSLVEKKTRRMTPCFFLKFRKRITYLLKLSQQEGPKKTAFVNREPSIPYYGQKSSAGQGN
jgi:hypothetical protein